MDAIEKRAREVLARMEKAKRNERGHWCDARAAVESACDLLPAIIAALTPPEGYVLVPVEPTEDMLRAGRWVEPPDAHGQQYIEKQGAAQCWQLMMNARPEVP